MTDTKGRQALPSPDSIPPVDALLPALSRLSRSERFQLVQKVIQDLAQEAERSGDAATEAPVPFDPRRFYGQGQLSRERIDAYLSASRGGRAQ